MFKVFWDNLELKKKFLGYMKKCEVESIYEIGFVEQHKLFMKIVKDYNKNKLDVDGLTELLCVMWHVGINNPQTENSRITSLCLDAGDVDYYLENDPKFIDEFIGRVLSYYSEFKKFE